ncbi:MAG: tRNA (N6-isopentenyl adenosine(37)-C2)-methylthiotransferase MiaB [Candidatus Caldatribacterium sp.]|nr:tRNA (N6-isopentenyl adenosine(37)-C2)-methylthiotransferase MiaB [Candidatus Caldatribacterium sp.]
MEEKFSFALVTFGCQMNKSRSEHLSYLFLKEGFLEAQEEEEADVIVFNTCAVREHAVAKALGVISHLYHANLAKKGKPPTIVLCGCMGELLREKLLERIPYVNVLTGTHDFDSIPHLVREAITKGERRISFSSPPQMPFLEQGYKREGRFSAYLPITYGCDNFCSYCVVPYTTGPQRSKPRELVLEELAGILGEGFREVTLLGQNVNTYGKDFGKPHAFEELLEGIERRFGKEKVWIRFITSHPRDMRRGIVEIVRGSRIFCPYFHLPLQAGSSRILHLMNRGYTKEQYLDIALFIREHIPEATIGTDIIVGFPTETDADFTETLEVVEKVQFEIAYTYAYSPRPRTKAAEFEDDVPQEVKKKRLAVLSAALRGAYFSRLSFHEGRETEVLLVEERKGLFLGRTRENLNVIVYPKEGLQLGDFCTVRLARNFEGKLVGNVKEC